MTRANELAAKKNEIVVYQPNETLRLEVQLRDESIWLPQQKIAELFGVQKAAISKHLKNIYASGELRPAATVSKMETVQVEGRRRVVRNVDVYNLDAIIAVGYRVNSKLATQFRIWATGVIKAYLLNGYAFNARMNQLEDKVDRRLAKHDQDIVELKEKVDFFVQTSLPPVQGVFFNGQVFDAHAFAAKHILNARTSILLIDSWVDLATLELLSKKNKGVSVEIVTSPRGNKLKSGDINTFNTQYGGLTVKTSKNFHDRFLIIDNKRLFLFGASLKDLGWKCFAFTELNASAILELKARV